MEHKLSVHIAVPLIHGLIGSIWRRGGSQRREILIEETEECALTQKALAPSTPYMEILFNLHEKVYKMKILKLTKINSLDILKKF